MRRIPMRKGEVVHFPWAFKHLLNQKGNYEIIEGFLSCMLENNVKIIESVKEVSSNCCSDTDTEDSSYDIVFKASNEEGEIILLYLQIWYDNESTNYTNTNEISTNNNCIGLEYDNLKSLITHINQEAPSKIRKFYSVSILYSPFGTGDDYIYKSERVFKGVGSDTELILPRYFQNIAKECLGDMLTLEHYLVKPDNFVQTPTNPLEEWMRYLHKGKITPGTEAPGLKEALQKLRVNTLNHEQSWDYLNYRSDMVKAILENKVNSLLEPLENLDKGMLTRYVKDYSKIFTEGCKKGLASSRDLGQELSRDQTKQYAKEYAKGYSKGYIRGGLLCSFEIAFRMIVMGEPYELILHCCNFNMEWIKELESL